MPTGGQAESLSRVSVVLALVLVTTACGGHGQRATDQSATRIIAAQLKEGLALYQVDPRTGQSVPLSTGRDPKDPQPQESDPACSPNGQHVVFMRETIHGTEFRLLELRNERSQLLRALNNPPLSSSALSPDGAHLAYGESVNGLRALDLRTEQVSVLSRGSDDDPSWSRDGEHLAFEHDRSGNGDTSIWTMAADGRDQHQLTRPPQGDADHNATWSPDGELMAFERPYDTWLINIRTGRERLLARFASVLHGRRTGEPSSCRRRGDNCAGPGCTQFRSMGSANRA